jgi:cytochrome c oxidase cbb3-type subunit III
MMNRLTLSAALAMAVAVGVQPGAQGVPTKPTSPRKGGNPEAARITSPVPDGPESRAAGRRTYQRLCTGCHGPLGKGDGGMAGAGGQPADFTDKEWIFGGSPGEVFTVIRDGTSADMDSYAERMSETDMWNLVNYIRSLSQE